MASAADPRYTFGLPAHALEQLRACLGRYPIERAIVFGSRAKGTHRYASDIDLTLIAPAMTHWQLLELEQAIDDLLLPWKVDLSLYHHIDNEALKAHIDRVGEPLSLNGTEPS
ncbi:nucleotidyltransferase domain-containing protein [Salicola sp. Rm-C-2C1-2]|uniref:nucleotidyltransferase family protein n=1 Tax=Salicola sp. Rm-C-2C1-2 TaxID=3141321 RepID=UPI0032E3BBB7